MNTNAAVELEQYPKYKEAYLRAFDKMLKRYETPQKGWENAEAVMDWWLERKPKSKELEGQINIFEQEILEDISRGD